MPAPPKPWERKSGANSGSSATPLGPSTSISGATKPWEQTSGTTTNVVPTDTGNSALVRNRPWETSTSSNFLGGSSNYRRPYGGWNNTSYGSGGMYNRQGYNSYGGYNSYNTPSYGGMGNNYGNYGSQYGGMNSYGGYGNGYMGSSYGGYGGIGGMGGGFNSYGNSYGTPGLGGPYGPQGEENQPPQPPTAWQSMLHAIGGVVHFFGRISFLVDENAHAFHFFITALLQLLDRCGSLYGELARFILRLLGLRSKEKEKNNQLALVNSPPKPNPSGPIGRRLLPGMPNSSERGFDSVWGQ